MKMYKRLARDISFNHVKREKKNIKAIVIHNTGNKRDSAKNNADFFATGNKNRVGAHFFVDRKGKIARSIPMNRTAWSVGVFYGKFGHVDGGSWWGTFDNFNTVSIELCDIVDQYPSKKQIKAVKKLVKYIKRYCKNVKYICRHWDICNKDCPQIMSGLKNKNWDKFAKDVCCGLKICK